MVSVELHIVAQIITLMVSIVNVSYFWYIYKYTKHAHLMKWEVIWVAAVESVNYAVQLATGSQRVSLGDGRYFPWSRYVAWQLTCPVLLSFIVTSVLKKDSVRVNVQVLMLLQFILLSGMTASLVSVMHFKILFVGFASVGFLFMDYYLFTNRAKDRSFEKSTHLLVYFTLSWTIFPLLFMLGPELTAVMPFEYTLIGHAIGDLISKNLFSVLAWNYLKFVHNTKNAPEDPKAPNPSEVSTPRRQAWTHDIEHAGPKHLMVRTEEATDELTPTGQPPSNRLATLENKFALLIQERQKCLELGLLQRLPMGLQPVATDESEKSSDE